MLVERLLLLSEKTSASVSSEALFSSGFDIPGVTKWCGMSSGRCS